MPEPVEPTPLAGAQATFRSAVGHLRAAVDAMESGALPRMVEALVALKPAVAEFVAAFDRHVTHELIGHPDLAELDVQLQGFYGGADV